MAPELTFSTPAFESGEPVPTRYTCDGADGSPELAIGGVPDGAESLAVVVDDPDAPGGTFTHWLLWGVPPETDAIESDVPATETVASLGDARQGTNGFGTVGYRGPCPPPGDGPHTYRFTLHALDGSLSLSAGADRSAFESAVSDRSIATARFTGTYER